MMCGNRKRIFLRGLPLALCALGFSVTTHAYTAPVESHEQYGRGTAAQQNEWPPRVNGAPRQQWVDNRVQPQKPNYLARVDKVEQELRQLRGQLEEQQHLIQQMQEAQRQFYQDLDQRITALGGRLQMAMDKTLHPVEPAAPGLQSTRPASNSAQTSQDKLVADTQAYQEAYDLLRAKHYPQARAALNNYLSDYPQGHYAVNAHYWLAELALLSGDQKMALQQFRTVVSNYPKSNKVPDAMLKMGLIYADQGNYQTAKEQLGSIKAKYPNSPSGQLAAKRLHELVEQGH